MIRVLREMTAVGLANHTTLIDVMRESDPSRILVLLFMVLTARLLVWYWYFAMRRSNERLSAIGAGQTALMQADARLEQQVAERAAKLQEIEALTRTFFDHSSECNAVLPQDGDSFRYEEVNPETLRLNGNPRDCYRSYVGRGPRIPLRAARWRPGRTRVSRQFAFLL